MITRTTQPELRIQQARNLAKIVISNMKPYFEIFTVMSFLSNSFDKVTFLSWLTEVYLAPCQTSMMELLCEIINT